MTAENSRLHFNSFILQILTWLILPIMQSYATSGEFRILRRIFSAIMENAIFYASFAILFLIFLIYIILTVAFNLYAHHFFNY